MKGKRGLLLMGILSSLFGLGGCKDSTPPRSQEQSTQINVTAQLNHLLMPLARGERYEDPLHELLAQKGLGEIDGGGTMQSQSGEILYIDVEIILNNSTEGIPFLIEQLEALGAPKGSILRIHDSEPSRDIPFGKIEGIAVYLDGVNLPDEVYASSDINVVIEEFNKRLDGHGEMQSYWQGPTETALYLYGENSEEMKRLISDFLNTYPLCKGARIVTIAPKGAERPPGDDSLKTAPHE
ncbi:MAG: hypothetical protein ACYS83_09130 [Planctomycetota bacterium]